MTLSQTGCQRSIILFRRDLRLSDNAALFSACQFGQILPVYIHENDDTVDRKWPIGSASKWWLHHSLKHLDEQLTAENHPLCYFHSSIENSILSILIDLCKKNTCTKIFWNRRYEPHHIEQDKALKAQLKEQGFEVSSFNNNLLSEPWQQFNKQGNPYKGLLFATF